MELSLQQVEKFLNLWVRQRNHVLGIQLRQERCPGKHLAGIPLGIQAEAEKSCHTKVAILLELKFEVRGTVLAIVGRNGQGRQNYRGRHHLQVGRSEVLLVTLGQVVQLIPGICVVKVVLRHPEDLSELCIVDCHHLWLGGLLHQAHQAVDVFHGSERFLPKLQISCDLQLFEASLQIKLETFWLCKIRAVALISVLVQVRKVITKNLAKTTELCGALVLQAELESLVCCHGVESLQLAIVTQDLKYSTVCLPQKLEAWCYCLTSGSFLSFLGAYIAQHEIFWSNVSFQVFHVQSRSV
mmetsp:Transcript_23763/g.28672  ORF Transcript_23763/g.28672 Transcript_23763/m.28672 type:complete len:298 (+) Transcript_23763:1589-2482(+)